MVDIHARNKTKSGQDFYHNQYTGFQLGLLVSQSFTKSVNDLYFLHSISTTSKTVKL